MERYIPTQEIDLDEFEKLSLPDAFRFLRSNKGLTRERMYHITGISIEQIEAYETGIKIPYGSVGEKFFNALLPEQTGVKSIVRSKVLAARKEKVHAKK